MQYEHEKLQPKNPTDKNLLPGNKWKNGRFSIGSTAIVEQCPAKGFVSCPSSFLMTPHSPISPTGIGQPCGQISQSTLPRTDCWPDDELDRCCNLSDIDSAVFSSSATPREELSLKHNKQIDNCQYIQETG